MKVVILNSTHHKRHFGCRLVTGAFERLCVDRKIEIIGRVKNCKSPDLAICEKADLVIVNAEGSIHHGKNENLLEVGRQFPSVLINGSMEELHADHSENLKHFKIVSARESLTQSYLAEEHGCDALLVPDVIFSWASRFHNAHRRWPQHQLFVSDSSSKTGPAHATLPVSRIAEYSERLADADGALLGRFHAICLAAMMGVPFVAWEANTWKNAGIMRDMSLQAYYHGDYATAAKEADAGIVSPVYRAKDYARAAQISVNELFNRIAAL